MNRPCSGNFHPESHDGMIPVRQRIGKRQAASKVFSIRPNGLRCVGYNRQGVYVASGKSHEPCGGLLGFIRRRVRDMGRKGLYRRSGFIKETQYVELSSRIEFQELFAENMFFEKIPNSL